MSPTTTLARPASPGLRRRFSLETPPVSGDAVHSAANFREVAPELLSPLSFTLVAGGMEIAFREIAKLTGETVTGPTPEYVSYIAYRPFHVMSSIDRFLARLPVVERADVWELLLGGPPPLAGESRERTAKPLEAWYGLRAMLHARRNGRAAGEASALVAQAEDRLLRARRDGSAIQAALGLDVAFRAAHAAWALHTRTTTVAAAAAAGLRRLFEQDYDDDTATDLLRHAARRGSEAAVASASAGRVTVELDRLSSYEVADGSDRFGRFRSATATAQPLGAHGMLTSTPGSNGNGAGNGHGRAPSVPAGEAVVLPRTTLAGRVAHRWLDGLDSILAERERSKELGLRALHCVRLLLEAGGAELPPEDAAMLGQGEIGRVPRAERDRLVAARSAELEEATKLDVAFDLEERGEELHPLRRPAERFTGSTVGTPLAPGWAEGPAMSEGTGGPGEIICGERVDGNYVLAVQPAGVVSAFGSLLSHVAIVCRELGIPLVSGINVDPDDAHGEILVDGWTGTVARVNA
jgi:rifampicin phosphotransferase